MFGQVSSMAGPAPTNPFGQVAPVTNGFGQAQQPAVTMLFGKPVSTNAGPGQQALFGVPASNAFPPQASSIQLFASDS